MKQTDKPREAAAEILVSVEEGAFADALLEQARRRFDHRDSAFILELVYGVLRQRSWLDWVLDRFSAKPLSRTDIRTRNILRLGAYQILFLDRVPVSASVDTATEIAKNLGRKSRYVNGLLRNLDRKHDSLPGPPGGDPARRLSVLYSHPVWLIRRWLSRLGPEKTETILRENNRPSPLMIRTNATRTTREQLKASLDADGATVVEARYSTQGLDILSSPGIRALTAYEKGWFLVQDEAAQLIGMMVDPRPGETVLDAAAAPGGKATHLSELMNNQGTVIALESDPNRIGRIAENAARLGASIVKPVLGDATIYHEGTFDRILIDAPCSGLGVLRRHPDGRWNKKEDAIRKRAGVQLRILQNCASLLRPGGALVYATCTTEPEENEEVVRSFLAAQADAFATDDPRPYLPEPARSLVDGHGFFRTFPDEPSLDGFFGARIIRTR